MDWIPRSVRQKQKSITEASKKLEALKGPNYSDADMAKELGISEEEYDTWMQQTNVTNISSLDDFMEQGNVLVSGTPEEILLHPSHPSIRRYLADTEVSYRENEKNSEI